MKAKTRTLPRAVALGTLICLALLAGVGCDLTAPGIRKDGVDVIGGNGGGGRVVEPKRCALTLVILSRPQNDPALNESLWKVADEQIATPEIRRALQTNGIRIGRITGDLPLEIQELLKARPPDQPDVQMIVNPSGQSSLIDAAHAAARNDLNLLISLPDGKVQGKVYQEAKGYLRLTATHEGSTGVALRLVPEVHHGPIRNGYGVVPTAGVAVPHEFQIVNGQQEETFRDLGTTLVLESGQIAVLGTRPERSGSLGALLFQKDQSNSDRVMQSIVLIWADRNERGNGPGAGSGLEVPAALMPVDPGELSSTKK